MMLRRFHPIVLATLALPAVSQVPTIRITSTPVFSTGTVLSGTVAGVPFATHSVGIYSHVQGAGWWSKPTAAARTVPIAPNGTWSATVVTGGLDHLATHYVAVLLGPGVMPPLATGTCRVPATLQALATTTAERWGRVLQFRGYRWAVKTATLPVGPGPNLFSSDPNDVFVDAQDRLHLRIAPRNGAWWSSEVILIDPPLGHGTYWFTTATDPNALPANAVFGFFPFDVHCDEPTGADPNREFDFEDSRWGVAGSVTNSQAVVQPWSTPGNRIQYTIPPSGPNPLLSRWFDWRPGAIEFYAVSGLATPCRVPPNQVLHHSVYVHDPSVQHRVPTLGRQQLRINAWIYGGGAPTNNQPVEIIIGDFRFAAARGTFRTGCGTNPRDSLRVVGGAPGLGQTVTLAVDNPAATQAPGSVAFLVLGLGSDPRYPCGSLRPGFGMTGPAGEVLVDLGAPLAFETVGVWLGPGQAPQFGLTVPNRATLLGLTLHAQGLILDASPGAAHPMGLTDGVELCVH